MTIDEQEGRPKDQKRGCHGPLGPELCSRTGVERVRLGDGAVPDKIPTEKHRLVKRS